MMETSYFETQKEGMCAMHAVNNLLGHSVTTPMHFSSAVKECAKETQLAEEHFGNERGNWSADVVTNVLHTHGLQVEQVQDKPLHQYMHDPSLRGFIVHDKARQHYTCIKFNGYQMTHMDSLKDSPEKIFQEDLMNPEWTLMAVRGREQSYVSPAFLQDYRNAKYQSW